MRLLLVACLGIVLCAVSVAPAGARTAYVTRNGSPGTVTAIDTATNAVIGSPIPVGANPGAIAITPDGSRAYVANFTNGTVSVIDTATNAVVGQPIPSDIFSGGIAITPDGRRVYQVGVGTGGFRGVVVIDTATNTSVTEIALGSLVDPQDPRSIAITPNGAFGYVVVQPPGVNDPGNVRVISTASNALTGGTDSIPVGTVPRGIAITPDGSRLYVANSGDGNMSVINTATNSTTGFPPIPILSTHVTQVAITPDGARAYVAGQTEEPVDPGVFAVIDTATNTATTPDVIGNSPSAVVITPDGSRAYIPDSGLARVAVIDTASNTPGTPVPVGSQPTAIAIVPNQPPVAAFTVASAPSGQPTTFDAAGTADPDGVPARFDWDFGDGTTLADGGPTATHTYAAPGTYTVFLRVTDNEGCSLGQVFTGQTVSCNGSGVARIAHEVAIAADASQPGLQLSGKKRQKLDGAIEVNVSCDEPCTATGNGKLVITTASGGGKSDTKRRGFKLKQASAQLTAGQPVTLKLKISKRVRGAASEVLAGDGEVTARITIVGVDAAGNEAKAKRTIRLRLKRSSS